MKFYSSRLYSCSLLLFCFSLCASGQLNKPALADSLFTTYYHQQVSHFKTLPNVKGDIIFIGNSITEGAEWSELLGDNRIKNRGISGDITAGVIHRIDDVALRKPAKVFLMIGINDLSRGIASDSVLKNIFWIAAYLKQESPSTQLYVQSILPVNDEFKKFAGHTDKSAEIIYVNELLKK